MKKSTKKVVGTNVIVKDDFMPNLEVNEKSLRSACDAIVTNAIETGGGKFARIPCSLLFIDTYQRGEKGKIKNIAENWNDRDCGMLLVSYRDGTFWVVDGRQRLAAARIIGVYDLKCLIFEGLTKGDEASMLSGQNKNKTPMSAFDNLHSEADVGHMPYADIKQICDNQNIKLTSHRRPGPNECGSVSKLIETYNRAGRDGLIWVLNTIRTISWSVSYGGYSSTVLLALCSVYNKSRGVNVSLVTDRINKLVNGMSPHETIRKAQEKYPRKQAGAALAEYFL